MKTLKELYHKIAEQEMERGRDIGKKEDESLDCLLHPEKYAPVIHSGECRDCGPEAACIKSCDFGAIEKTGEGKVMIHPKSAWAAASASMCASWGTSRRTGKFIRFYRRWMRGKGRCTP